MIVSNILSEPGRVWNRNAPADEAQIMKLVKSAPFQLPIEYIDLLRFCDGGFGELDLPPLGFVLDSAEESVTYNTSKERNDEFSNFWFFGGNGGLEIIAFDLRRGPPWAIVMIDPIAGQQSAVQISPNIADFIAKIGIRPTSVRKQ